MTGAVRQTPCVLIVCLFLPLLASAAGAQVLQPPPRPYRGLFGGGPPPDPTRSRQELTLRGNLLGGYDDNLMLPGSGDTLGSHPSGSLGFGDAMLSYWHGRDVRSFEASGRGYVTTYRNIGVAPSYGGDFSARARTTLGRRNEIMASQNVRYAPFFSLGVFGPLQGAIGPDNPDSNPTNALTESGFWTTDASASFSRQWTRATKMDLGYAFSKQTYVDGTGFDSRVHAGSVGFEQSISRSARMRAAYHRSDSEFVQRDASVVPNLSQTAELGLHYQRRLSRTRQIAFAGGAGALSVDTLDATSREPFQYWTPSGYGTVRLDLGRSWGVAADYRRAVSVLQGITPEPFVTHAGNVTAGGYLGRRVEGVMTAGYSNGMTSQETGGGGLGQFDGYAGTVQLRFRLMRWWSSVVSINHYQYRLNTIASRMLGVPPEMHRNAVRVGFTWLLPLYGSSLEHPEPLSGARN